MITIDVWLAPVTPGAGDDPELVASLEPWERERIAGFGFAADRDRAVTARALARAELGRRLDLPPREVPLITEPNRGPYVAGHDLAVGWSHSGAWVAVATGETAGVGIDLEQVPAVVPAAALRRLGISTLEEFVALEAASKATGCRFGGRWPPGITVRRLCAPRGYLAAVAAPGSDWRLEVHLPVVAAGRVSLHPGQMISDAAALHPYAGTAASASR